MEYKLFIFILQLYSMTLISANGVALFGDQCKQVSTIDCENSYKPEGNETVCCSDLKVYNNLCFFAKQKCKDPSLTVLYPGHCVPVSATPAPDLGNTSDITYNDTKDTVTAIPTDPVLDAFCANKDVIVCQDDLDPICGTDNQFYKNNCEFAMARCDNAALSTQALTVCKAALRVRRILRLS
ncbi:agrin-like [Mercenaria mercenaria]|uniref:agrin-like n=1 Tax=Mercenaria mercenaria TaxID=6596 RepID=UPI00234EFC33|nr:agrin-like [Mercenaria mercenaria]